MFLTLAFGVQAVLAGNNLVFLIFTLMAGFGLSLAALTALLPSRVATPAASRRPCLSACRPDHRSCELHRACARHPAAHRARGKGSKWAG